MADYFQYQLLVLKHSHFLVEPKTLQLNHLCILLQVLLILIRQFLFVYRYSQLFQKIHFQNYH
jgi:hypothetical protein